MRLRKILLIATATLLILPAGAKDPSRAALKDVFKDKFKIGMTMTQEQLMGKDPVGKALNAKHCNFVLGGDCFKQVVLQPVNGNTYNWNYADQVVDFARQHSMEVVGHTLIWHAALEKRFKPKPGGGYEGTRAQFKRWMKDYITTVVKHFRGKVTVWDVVNEAIMEDGSYRMSPAYYFLGEEFIPLAFKYAHEADPDAMLYINDYAMWEPAKRATYKRIIKDLKRRGLRVDAIGMQCHFVLDLPVPTVADVNRAIKDLASAGVKVMITELDLSALPPIFGTEIRNPAQRSVVERKRNPYPNGLPADVERRWNNRMRDLLDVFIRNSRVIDRVNVWGVTDMVTWRNSYPVAGRTDYPLWFDRQGRMKPFLKEAVTDLTK